MMVRIWLTFCVTAIFLCSTAGEAKRVALIIGNSDYDKTSSLENASNDAKMIAESIKQAGFDDIILARDLKMKEFQSKLRDFRQKANGADVAMVYYAGHGIEGQGKNWLIPVDARLKTNFDLPYEAIDLERVMESLKGAQIRMVVLDACRNNPFGRSWRSSSRSLARGLVGVEADDVLVIYAAAPGQTAADGDGENSPFAISLAKRLIQPDLPIQMLGGLVRDDVLNATGGEQRPYVSASITGTPIYLVRGGPQRVAATTPPAVPATSSGNRARLDALSWRGALSADSAGSYGAYLTEFPSGLFADLAKDRITELRQPLFSGRVSTIERPPRPIQIASSNVPNQPQLERSTDIPPPVQSDVGESSASTNDTASNDTAAVAVSEPNATSPDIDARNGPQTEQEIELAAADRAYIPPVIAEPDLPVLPPTPALLQKDYPDCRENHQLIELPFDKANDINSCTVALDKYYTDVLNAYRVRMNEHQDEISAIYTEKVAGRMEYSAANRDGFYADMMQEHADSNPDGANLATYRAAVDLYNQDRNYLRDRFCYNTGCGGYALPDNAGKYAQKSDDKGSDRKKGDGRTAPAVAKKSGGKKCKKSRGRGRLLGAIFGGLAGKAAGLGKLGTALASVAGAVLVGEIACQLNEKEQEKAAEATFAVTEAEEVGATATWMSPERKGVSGSSTVTALNTQPNGRRCLSITDVAIIDGEETRISKQMCKGKGDEGYVITA